MNDETCISVTPYLSSDKNDATLRSSDANILSGCLEEDSPPPTLKRKNMEEHERRPGVRRGSGISVGSWQESTTCYICFNDNHRTRECFLLERYNKYGERAPRLGPAAIERCRAWLRDGDAGVAMIP